MAKKSKKRARARNAQPRQARSVIGLADWAEDLTCSGYTSLSRSPEVITAVSRISRLVASMSIQLMQNTDKGDVRVRNGLSRLVDVEPSHYMTRGNFYEWLVKTALLDGGGNAYVLPISRDGFIDELRPLPNAYAISDGQGGYFVESGGRRYLPDEVLHFAINPSHLQPWLGTGFTVQLRDIANNLKQARATENGFMASKWKPSIIVKVDALADEFSSKEGRKKLLESYVESGSEGEPWLIPAEQFDVTTVKPLTLQDLALSDFVELDKRAVAAILGIPAFVLGVGEFKLDAWQNFVNTTIKEIAQTITQELTRKLLYSPDLYYRFNPRSLMNYDLATLANIADAQYVRGLMTGDEVRDWIGLAPVGLDEFVMLENYIPASAIGDQSKLRPNNGEGGQNA
jgi:HK97 family phage portal protein